MSINKPQNYDIQQIQELYGPAVATPTPTPTPNPTPTPSPTGAPKAVKILDAAGRVWYADAWREIPANAMTAGETF